MSNAFYWHKNCDSTYDNTNSKILYKIQKMNNKNGDKILIDTWIKGDSYGFAQLYQKYKSRIYGFLIKMTKDKDLAEDLMQETFFAAYRNAGQFDRNRNFLSWLFGIAHKRTIDYFRHAKVEKVNRKEIKKFIGTCYDHPDDILSCREVKNIINREVEKLEKNQREVLLMRVLGDVKFKEIAEIMDCSINTVLGRMYYVHKKIRKKLQEKNILVN